MELIRILGDVLDYFVNDEEFEWKVDQSNANNESKRTELSDTITQFVMTSSEIPQNFDTDNVKLIWQQMAVEDDNELFLKNITPSTISNDVMFEKMGK